MCNELVRENVVMDKRVGKETTQILLEGDIIVPDIKPDISVVLQNNANIIIDKSEVTQNRINFMGRMDIQVLYLAKGVDKPIHSMTTTVAIDDFLSMDNVTREMWTEVRAELQNMEYKILNDRKLSFRGIVNIFATSEATENYDVVTNISELPENQLKKYSLDICKNITNNEDRFVVKEELKVQGGSPNIREILQFDVEIINKELRINDGKASILGEAKATILYKGDSDESVVDIVEQEIPFNGVVEISELRENMYGTAELKILDQYIQVKQDEDGEDRVFEIEVSVGSLLKISSVETLELLEDAYCINKKMNISKTPVCYKTLVCRNKNQSTVKDIIQVDGPGLLQIFRIKGSCTIDDVKKMEDKIAIEGIVNLDILYITDDDETPLYSYGTALPFRQIIEAKGLDPDMVVTIESCVEHIGFNMLSGKEIEVRILLGFLAEVVEYNEVDMINDIEFDEIPSEELEKMPSMTIYIVQKNDTLWDIAKKYNTTIDEIVSINDIENPDLIHEGDKLLILKKV